LKPDGRQRPLAVAALEDKIVQRAATALLNAIYEEEFLGFYLHYVFDLWAERRREATGDMIIVRYADDLVVGFEHEGDAGRFWDAMRERLQEFSLSLHPEKTRLFESGRHAATNRKQRGLGKPETFKFLGFIFICGTLRRGRFLLKRKSRGDRIRAKLREIKAELRRRMHQSIPEQGKWARQVGLSLILCVRPVQHQQTNLSPKTTANCVLASIHSRGGRFHSSAALLRTRYSNFIAASSLGKWPLARMARRSFAFRASIAFVV
jgi:hypothetical protein